MATPKTATNIPHEFRPKSSVFCGPAEGPERKRITMVRGRKRATKPEILRLTGSRHAERDDPVVEPGAIEMPEGLSAAGAGAWADALAAVKAAGLESPSFAMGVALLAEALGDWRECCAECVGVPRIRETERGAAVHPSWKLRSQSWERLSRAAKEFGLTASSFGGVRVAVRDGEQKAGIPNRTSIRDFKLG